VPLRVLTDWPGWRPFAAQPGWIVELGSEEANATMNPDARCFWAAIEELADLVVSQLPDNPKLHGDAVLGR